MQKRNLFSQDICFAWELYNFYIVEVAHECFGREIRETNVACIQVKIFFKEIGSQKAISLLSKMALYL